MLLESRISHYLKNGLVNKRSIPAYRVMIFCLIAAEQVCNGCIFMTNVWKYRITSKLFIDFKGGYYAVVTAIDGDASSYEHAIAARDEYLRANGLEFDSSRW